MSRIRVLPEILANKIAAGEIVERPASIVKELVENSLDAGAQSIQVVVESGGKRLILVRDDGEGMSEDDAILAFEHHATSKLEKAEDLTAIATLGFRGEALPSIASISRLELRSKHRSSPAEGTGTEIRIQGGVVRAVKPIAWDRGTEVSVRNIFFNLPARRKFLRSNDTELGHITRLVTHYALARPGIRFQLKSEKRVLIDTPPVGTTKERIYQLFGEKFLANLIEITGSRDRIRVRGFCSKPHEQRTNPYSQFFHVNRRMVRDKVISSAVRQAYRNCMPSSAYPVALVFIELPYDQVDVNAHPSKIEIRFRQQGAVHDLIRDSIRDALVISPSIPVYRHGNPGDWSSAAAERARHGYSHLGESDRSSISEAGNSPQEAFQYPSGPMSDGAASRQDHQSLQVRGEMLIGEGEEPAQSSVAAGARILGQMQDSYIIASDREGLLIVDQHVAHERILYEQLARAMRERKVESQGLLAPLAVELLPHQVPVLDRVLSELNRSGFQVEQFGGDAVLIRSVPAVVKDQDGEKLLREILDGIDREERTLDVQRLQDRIAVSMACHAAIKVNTPLSLEKMQWLLDELARTAIPTNCPHGRPIILRFTLREIEKNFGR